jgi:polar amino acid transport system permease protein
MILFPSSVFGRYLAILPEALGNTLLIWLFSVALGICLGLLLALTRLSRARPIAWLSRMVVDVGRSMPLLVIIYLIYFGIIGLIFPIPPLVAASLAIGLKLGFYLSEVFRSGIQGVPVGYVEAAKSLGMGGFLIRRRLVLPIAVRLMLPAIGQYLVGTLLDTSFASTIGAAELTQQGRVIIDLQFATGLWVAVAATYFIMAFPLSRFLALLERRWAVSLI